ncbi:MAG: hypothetical protein HYX57_03910 [Chloroflexi bacterium]|nr:hypothetical protein [Chloroflexota bacterium]
MAERPAPLFLVVDPGASPNPDLPPGSYAAVGEAGRRRLAIELSRRLGSQGAGVASLHPARPPAGEAFHWGRWFTAAARSVLARVRAEGRPLDAIGYAGAGALALADDALLEALTSAIPGEAVGNNRHSTDAFLVGTEPFGPRSVEAALAALQSCSTDNAAIRCLEAAGFASRDLAASPWARFDVDTPLDLALLRLAVRLPGTRRPDGLVTAFLEMAALPGGRGLELPRLGAVAAVLRDREAQLVVAGRIPSAAWSYLETESACRVRCFIEERGMRSARDAAPHSLLADWTQRLGPADLVRELASLGDAVILDTRVVMAARAGSSDGSAWPPAEERFASDFLDATPVATAWLAELTAAAAESDVPILLGGHALVSDGLRILVDAAWLGR